MHYLTPLRGASSRAGPLRTQPPRSLRVSQRERRPSRLYADTSDEDAGALWTRDADSDTDAKPVPPARMRRTHAANTRAPPRPPPQQQQQLVHPPPHQYYPMPPLLAPPPPPPMMLDAHLDARPSRGPMPTDLPTPPDSPLALSHSLGSLMMDTDGGAQAMSRGGLEGSVGRFVRQGSGGGMPMMADSVSGGWGAWDPLGVVGPDDLPQLDSGPGGLPSWVAPTVRCCGVRHCVSCKER